MQQLQTMTKAVGKGRQTRCQAWAASSVRRITRALAKASPTSISPSDTPRASIRKEAIGSAKKKATPSKDSIRSLPMVEWVKENDVLSTTGTVVHLVRQHVLPESQPTDERDTDSIRDDQQQLNNVEGDEPRDVVVLVNEQDPKALLDKHDDGETSLAPRKKGDGGAAPRKKGGRGAARMPKGWGEEGKQLMVYLDQDGRNIIGPDVNEYKTAVGCLARNGMRLPLHYPSFKFIPEHFKKGAWMEIQHNCGLPDSVESIVLKDLKDVWRNWKHHIKATYYIPNKHDESYLCKVPTERIIADQWPKLVAYWKDKRVEELAERNSANGYKRSFPHRTGRTSFAVIVDELKSKGKMPDNLELWMLSRSRGKGPEDEHTEDRLEFLNRELSKIPEDQRTPAMRDALFTHAFGTKRKRRGGLGKALMLPPHPISVDQNEEIRQLAKEIRAGLGELKAGLGELKVGLGEINATRAEIAKDKAEIKMQVQKMESVSARLESMMNLMGVSPQEHWAASTTQYPQVVTREVFQRTLIGTRVKLQCQRFPKITVAEGVIVSLPPTGDNLGLVKISITHVINPNERLLLATRGGATVMGDALEQVVEWPVEDVVQV